MLFLPLKWRFTSKFLFSCCLFQKLFLCLKSSSKVPFEQQNTGSIISCSFPKSVPTMKTVWVNKPPSTVSGWTETCQHWPSSPLGGTGTCYALQDVLSKSPWLNNCPMNTHWKTSWTWFKSQTNLSKNLFEVMEKCSSCRESSVLMLVLRSSNTTLLLIKKPEKI